MKGPLSLSLLILGIILAGFSLGYAVSLPRGEGVADYSGYNGGFAGPGDDEIDLVNYYFVYDEGTGEVVRVVEGALIACIVYAPPESNFSILLRGDGASMATVRVNVEGHVEGEAPIRLSGNATIVNVARFEARGIYPVSIIISGSSGVYGLSGDSLYATKSQDVPYAIVLAAVLGVAASYAGYRSVSGRASWVISYSLLPLMILLVAVVYGLSRPLDGFSTCVHLNHVPQGWNAGESYSLNKLATVYVLGEVLEGSVSQFLLVLAAVSSSLIAAGFIEAGLGEYETLLFPSRTRNYLVKVLLPTLTYSMLPGMVVVLGHLLLYGTLPGGALYSSLFTVLLTLGPVAVIVSVTMLVGLLSRRASAAVVVGVTVALLPLLGFFEVLSPSRLLDEFYYGTELSGTMNSDLPTSGMASLLPFLVELILPLLIVSSILLVLGWIIYSRWEP